MNCKEAEKAIAGFVENKLKDDTMEAFIAHTRTCPDCMEELSIQYLVAVGMSRLEEGGTFDLGGELERKLENYENRIRRRKRINATYFGLEIAFVAVMAFVSVFFLY